ncbi:uncharacterized protein PGTG_21655 [Puccinia graminis f. sp. tritici CRL 75-36-700-3]|uniref:Uncharacterized protein n=1 Tax=Puccinia graminis f. sp. tritici (strain CRL 75-36-700-3 / race SCCL) TaxID=418459 RepID=H6QSB8_PUCGT|nr:uncharacterized protein PGTG_21655 [Puccinia graminis f. sp. tritici CRL 75-36-700-3]EHS63646.1 hypothetical protein PGTG_21655 [Puccinia graminis f. sp. tritici CRL 75-36-700-3]
MRSTWINPIALDYVIEFLRLVRSEFKSDRLGINKSALPYLHRKKKETFGIDRCRLPTRKPNPPFLSLFKFFISNSPRIVLRIADLNLARSILKNKKTIALPATIGYRSSPGPHLRYRSVFTDLNLDWIESSSHHFVHLLPVLHLGQSFTAVIKVKNAVLKSNIFNPLPSIDCYKLQKTTSSLPPTSLLSPSPALCHLITAIVAIFFPPS